MSAKQDLYFFGGGRAEGDGSMRDILGGKGAGLAEMTNATIPVPPGFTIATTVCLALVPGWADVVLNTASNMVKIMTIFTASDF